MREIVGFTNGCFDLFHKGHWHFLQACKRQCYRLIVAVDSDEGVAALKGDGRPIDPWMLRMKHVAECTYFGDEVLPFDGNVELRELIAEYHPDIIFKGSDYEGKEVVGSDLAKVILIPRLEGFSTTELLAKRMG